MTASSAFTQMLRELHALNRRRKAHLAACTLAWALLAAAALFLAAALLDILAPLSPAARWTAALLAAAPIPAGLVLAAHIALKHLSDQALAAIAGQALPDSQNALINAVQLQKHAPPAFIDALLKDAPGARPADIPATRTYPRSTRIPLAWTAPALLLAAAAAALLAPDALRAAALRILRPDLALAPYAETRITQLSPGHTAILRGDTVTVTASLEGHIPEKATLEWRAEETRETADMTPGENTPNTFTAQLPPRFTPGQFRVTAHDAVSPWFDVTIENLPGLENWECRSVPPPYTNRKPADFTAADETREIIAGSKLTFAAAASRPLAKAVLETAGAPLATCAAPDPFTTFICRAQTPEAGELAVTLETPDGRTARIPLPVTLIPDLPPAVTLVRTPVAVKTPYGESVILNFSARDDFGIDSVTLEHLLPGNQTAPVAEAHPDPNSRQIFHGRFLLDTGTFDRKQPVRVRLCARDIAESPNTARTALSPVITVTFLSDDEAQNEKDARGKKTLHSLEQLLARQKNALRNTNETMSRTAETRTPPPADHIAGMSRDQTDVRTAALEILQNRAMLGILGDTLAGLANLEMPRAIEAIEHLHQTPPKELLNALQKIADIQTKIIANLTAMNSDSLANEEKHKSRADCFEQIQKLVKDQNTLIKQTRNAGKSPQNSDVRYLARCQTTIARAILAFNDFALKTADEYAQDEFAVQLRNAVTAVDRAESYTHAVTAVEILEEDPPQNAEPEQKLALKGLAEAYTILNQWRINQAKKTVAGAKDTIAEVKETLRKLEDAQARIAEITRELAKRKNAEDDPSLRDDLDKAAEERDKLVDMLEKCANDLYQFPDLPVCNELNTKMREIFEDVLQAKDSEKLKAVEIAVQKEDALLDLIRNTTERIDDVEMWLPDIPDHFVWNMESFDSDEFPEMPLVELPEELQDIVGELLEQDEQIDAQSQDTTGNNMVADMEMGWMVMDGPMPSFSAKGKSGNTRPNDNEMTGRSGSGREGMSTGELVENHVKGYEGRKTKARKTNDPYQKGQVTEDKDSTMDARSTGGGKLGGDSETIGMFGNAQRRDLHRAAHGKTPRKLREETDVLFAKARLLYANPGSLGEAVHHLNPYGKNPPDLKSFETVRKKVIRRLTDAVIEIREGTVLPMPVDPVTKQQAAAADQRKHETISDEYKQPVHSYFKSLGQ